MPAGSVQVEWGWDSEGSVLTKVNDEWKRGGDKMPASS